MAVRREYISGLYRDLLGREGSDQEVSGWENAGSEDAVRSMFLGSPEYTSQHGGQQTWEDVGGQITPWQTSEPPGNVLIQGPPPPIGGGAWHGYDAGTPPPAGQAPIPFTAEGYGDAYRQLQDAYQQNLGRYGSPEDILKWFTGQFGWGHMGETDKFISAIAGSDEARARRRSTPSPDPYTGFTPTNDYSAFNTSREQDPGRSAKDAFAMISNNAPPPPGHDRAALSAWFNQYIRPGMDALGHRVLSADSDGFTYTNHEGTFRVDFYENAGAPAGSMRQRLQWNATPADEATRARYPGAPGGTGPGGGGTGGAGGTLSDLRGLYGALGQQYGGPGGPGITSGPLQQVGQDQLSELITGALANFIGAEGRTSFGGTVQDALAGILERGGELPADQIARRFESARELLDKGRRTMVNDLRGDLASRNLLSEPGIPQGAESGGLTRITERLAPEFSRALRDIYSDESAKSDARMMTALQMATGFSTDQARNLLASIGEGTARQTALADLALRSLQTNMAWNQFLAQFGLQRDQVMYEIQNGGIDRLLPILQAFLQLGGMANAGYT